MKIVTVLRQSQEYKPYHAQWLHRQLEQYDSLCLTDAGEIQGVNTLPLQYEWPSWWSKIEVFNPYRADIGSEDILLIDIDTVITGDLTPFLQKRAFTALTDFYAEGTQNPHMASGLMFIPAEIKHKVWDKFIIEPAHHMQAHIHMPHHGDQGFISTCLNAERWQAVLPGAVVSYKRDVAAKDMPGYHSVRSKGNGMVPENTRIVCFHGNPRPWRVGLPWIPPL